MKTIETIETSHKSRRRNLSSGQDVNPAGEILNVPSRHKKPPPHPTRSGMVSCLRCGEMFESWDRRQNRICPNCAGRS